MGKILKDANDKTTQAEFVCIDSCNDKDGQLFKPTRLASPSVFTTTPRADASSVTPVLEKNSQEGVYRRRMSPSIALTKDDDKNPKAVHKGAKKTNAVFGWVIPALVLFAMASLSFVGYKAWRFFRAPISVHFTQATNMAEVDIFFEKDAIGKYVLRDSVQELNDGRKWSLRREIKVPLCKFKPRMVCGEVPCRKFTVIKYPNFKRYAFCRWITIGHDSIIHECVLTKTKQGQSYAKLFGEESFCRLDFDLPDQEPSAKPRTEIIVKPEPLPIKVSPFARIRQAGAKVSGGILFVLRRMVRSTQITYHRAVVTLKELLNLAEPKVKFLGGAAHSFAKETVWLNVKGGYNRFYKGFRALLRR